MWYGTVQAVIPPKDVPKMLEGCFVFALIWSIGASTGALALCWGGVGALAQAATSHQPQAISTCSSAAASASRLGTTRLQRDVSDAEPPSPKH